MESKTLLAGLIGFFLGGLLVAVAATTFDRQEVNKLNDTVPAHQQMQKADDKH